MSSTADPLYLFFRSVNENWLRDRPRYYPDLFAGARA